MKLSCFIENQARLVAQLGTVHYKGGGVRGWGGRGGVDWSPCQFLATSEECAYKMLLCYRRTVSPRTPRLPLREAGLATGLPTAVSIFLSVFQFFPTISWQGSLSFCPAWCRLDCEP